MKNKNIWANTAALMRELVEKNSATELANIMGVTRQFMNKLLKGECAIPVERAANLVVEHVTSKKKICAAYVADVSAIYSLEIK